MQDQSAMESGKVIAFAKKSANEIKIETQENGVGPSFADVEKRNRDAAERLKKERAKANRSVLRAYRIKN